MPAATERVIAERYELKSALGGGAMGTVWLAEDALLKRRVAIKEIDIPPGFDGEERDALAARMLREARAAARLSHPGIVSVFDVVEDGDSPYIVMEYVDAPTLDELVATSGPLSPEETARIGIELLSVLETAHAEGIVHRDVKPSNVMCPDEGPIKLADFGIASVQDDPKITQTGLVLGSPSFMAPEQAQTGKSGPESDLWSLGATLYQAVEGRPPFDKGAPLPTLTAVMTDEPAAMTRAGTLEPVITALLQKDPKARPSIAETRARLQAVGSGDVTTSAAPATPTEVGTRPAPAPAPSPETRSEPRYPIASRVPERDMRWAWVALALALLALIVVPLWLANRDPAEEPRENRAGAGQGRDEDGGDTGTVDGSEPAPNDWVEYVDETTGYVVHHPEGWELRPADDTALDFVEPDTGSYLRVAWTDEPGDDVMARLEEIAASFAAENSNYAELQMAETEYQGFPAGLWEYSYEEDGAQLHAYNLQFVIGDEYGFALNFQTHEEDWASSQDLWETLRATFEPPG
jgi:eukaryotic-like serine/threonine-protein kinase